MTKKLKWNNIIKLMVMIACVGLIIQNMYALIQCNMQFTWFGASTFICELLLTLAILYEFKEELQD